MPRNFWKHTKRPFFAIAPMANVTDAAFRRMFAKYGKPNVLWTEFVSVEGLLSEGRKKLLPDLWFTEAERPIVAQVFGAKPEHFREAAALIRELGFDGIDINMGCPDKAVLKQGAGAALIRTPALAKKIIRATKEGAGKMPVSVKTRIGSVKNETKTWLSALLEEGVDALTVHLRTKKELSEADAHWELAPKILALRDRIAPQTRLIGNGDVRSLEEAFARAKESGFDGIMIGRGVFGNPWFFSDTTPSLRVRFRIITEHAALFEKLFKSNAARPKQRLKNFDVMKKHFKAYVSGFDGAKELRVRLMAAEDSKEIRSIVASYLKKS